MTLFDASGQGMRFKDETVASHFLGGERTVHIYLPPSYATKLSRRYPVLYLHDGQNVFSTAGTNACFGWGAWNLDLIVDELCRNGKMGEIIMVAVDNSPARISEYSGRARSTNTDAATPFENYAAFLIHELKPAIDAEYRTKTGPSHTGVMGSSMGGICSFALGWEHPEVFGGVACLSSSFQIDHSNFVNNVLPGYHDKPKPCRIYLDSGIVDFTGGDDNCALTAKVANELRRIGWKKNLKYFVDTPPLTEAELEKAALRRDKWREAQTSQHNEFYWRLRSWRPLTFLFPP